MLIHKTSLIAKIKHHYYGFSLYRDKLTKFVDNIKGDALTDRERDAVLVNLKLMREEIEQMEKYVNGEL